MPFDAPSQTFMSMKKIETFLSERGFQITRIGNNDPPDTTLDTLALLLSFQFATFQHLLRHMRGNMRKNPGFFLPLTDLSRSDVGMIKNLCYLLEKNGLLSECHVDKQGQRLRGSVALNDRALNFLEGRWLERCVEVNIESFLNLEPHRMEFASNVHVIRPPQSDGVQRRFELDALLSIDGQLYWWEAKSGQYADEHLTRYAAVAKELNLSSRRCLLVLAQPEKGTAFGELGKQMGFQVIRPQDIPRKIEEIEDRHR